MQVGMVVLFLEQPTNQLKYQPTNLRTNHPTYNSIKSTQSAPQNFQNPNGYDQQACSYTSSTKQSKFPIQFI